MKFALHAACRNDHETGTIAAYCALNRETYRVFNKASEVPDDFIPVGTVPWVEEVLKRPEVPNYYPDFLQHYLHRKIWQETKWPYGHRVFIKPADRHKRFTGFITNGKWKGKKKGPYWCSEVVQFVTEWRWYVADGVVIAAKWGSGIEKPVPTLDVQWPKGFYGAVDFGELDNGKIALIESNSPFACGWYGSMSEGAVYAEWLSKSWLHLKSK